jgi:tetratricopeptide (TPR) repeat protein
MRLAPRSAIIYYRRIHLLRARGDIDGAIAATEYALSLNPNFAGLHAERGRNKIDQGRADEAIEHIEEAMRLSPDHPSAYLWYYWAGQAEIHLGRYQSAVEWLQKSRQAHAGFPQVGPWLAVAYAELGRDEDSRKLIAEHLGAGHPLTIELWNKRMPPGSGELAEQRQRILTTLRRLGVPEGEFKEVSSPSRIAR